MLLILFPCILLWPVFTGRVLLPAHLLADVFPWRSGNPNDLVPWNPLQFDGITQFYPWRKFAAETLQSGYVPLWNPYEFCGTPFLANSQSAVLYPLNLLFVALPVMYAFGASAILHLAMTGMFLYLFLRRSVGVSRTAALIGATAWQLSSWQVSWLALPSFLDTSAWFPLALLLTDRLAIRPTAGRAAGLGACLGVMMLAGHLQIALYGLLMVALYGIYRAAVERLPLIVTAGAVVLALGLMVGIEAPQLLPTLELSRVSHRAGEKASEGGYKGYVRLATPGYQVVTMFLPGFFGHPGDRGAAAALPTDPPGAIPYHGETAYWGATNYAENACYVGVLALFLALVAVVSGWRQSRDVRFFAGIAVAALLIAVGSPIDRLFYFGIPGFSQTGSPARIFCLWALSLSVLAAIGVDSVIGKSARLGWSAGAFAALALGATAYSVVALTAIVGKDAPILAGAANDIRLLAGLSIAVAATLALYYRGTLSPATAGAWMTALVAVDLLGTGFGYNHCVAPRQVYPVTPAIAYVQAHALNERVMPHNTDWSLYRAPDAIFPPNAGTVYGLREVQGYDSLQTGQYKSFARDLSGGTDPSPRENGNMTFANGAPSEASRMAAVRFHMFPPTWPSDGAVYAGPDAVVFADSAASPRVVDQLGPNPSFQSVSPTRLEIGCTGPSDLTISSQWYPGWKATFDGHPVAIREGPKLFRTVTVPRAGRLHLTFGPDSFRVGLYLMATALAAICGIWSGSVFGKFRH